MPSLTKSAFVLFVFDSSTSEKITFSTDLSRTICEVKQELAQMVTVPSTHMRLSCRGKILHDSRTLLSHGIKNGQILHLTRARMNEDRNAFVKLTISVYHDSTPRPILTKFCIRVRATDQVLQVKQQLAKVSGIAVNEQRLTMGGQTLTNERRLCDYGALHESTELQLVCPFSMTNLPLIATFASNASYLNRSEFPVNVKEIWPLGQLHRIGIRIDKTIHHFKKEVAVLTGVSPDQQLLMHRGRVLLDDLTANFYNLEGGDTIDLAIVGGLRWGQDGSASIVPQEQHFSSEGSGRQQHFLDPPRICMTDSSEMPMQTPLRPHSKAQRCVKLAPLECELLS